MYIEFWVPTKMLSFFLSYDERFFVSKKYIPIMIIFIEIFWSFLNVIGFLFWT